MIPQVGQHVKCVLRNNTVVEGFVKDWNKNQIILQSLSEESILIIMHPEEDIMLIKIILENFTQAPEQLPIPWEHEEKSNYGVDALRKEFRERLYGPEGEFKEAVEVHNSQDEASRKSLAELRLELSKQEKKIITEKLKDHLLGEVRKVQYGYPGSNKKPRSQ